METIDKLRCEVDRIDDQILQLLSDRIETINRIAYEKEQHNLPLVDKKREDKMKECWMNKAKKLHMNQSSIQNIFYEIVKMSKESQQRIIK